MMGSGYNPIGNVDTALSYAASVGWILLGLYAVVVFFSVVRRQGLRLAFIRLFSYQVLIPLVIVIGIQLFSAALVFVRPPYVSVVVSIVSPGGIRPQPLRSGLHWILPFLEHSVEYPIHWQTYTMAGKVTEGAKLGDDSIRTRTSDGQEVRMDVSLIFRIDLEQAVSIHIDWQGRYIDDLIQPVTRGVVRTQVSQYTVREVNSSVRKDLESALDHLLRDKFADKGLILDQFLLRDITFTQEYADSIEKKQVALEGKERTLHEAEQLRNLAQGRANAVEIEAQAEAKALKLIGEALKEDPQLLTYRYIDKLSPNIRVMLVPSQTPLILPPELLQNREDSP